MKIVFLYDNVKKVIYVIQLIRFEVNNKRKIDRLKKTLYNLK